MRKALGDLSFVVTLSSKAKFAAETQLHVNKLELRAPFNNGLNVFYSIGISDFNRDQHR